MVLSLVVLSGFLDEVGGLGTTSLVRPHSIIITTIIGHLNLGID